MKANVGFPNEEICKGIFDEIIFTELQRDEAQELMEGYNKEAQAAGFGKKHLEYQNQWEQNKRMRGFGPHFGRGGPRGGFMPRGGFRGMPRGMPRGGGWGGYGGGYGDRGGGGQRRW